MILTILEDMSKAGLGAEVSRAVKGPTLTETYMIRSHGAVETRCDHIIVNLKRARPTGILRRLTLSGDERFQDLRDEVMRENLRRSAEQRKQAHDFQQLARRQWDRLRDIVRRRHLDTWLNDVAQRLGRPRNAIRRLGIVETYGLQDANPEAGYLWRTGRIPGFEREVPVEQVAEIYRLLDKIAARLPDSPVYLLCGTDVLWLRNDEPERWEVWGNGSGYFGAVEAMSAETLANVATWLDRDDDVSITMVSATDRSNSLALFFGRDQRGDFWAIQLIGPQWGLLLADERSAWTYEGWLGETIRLRSQHGTGAK